MKHSNLQELKSKMNAAVRSFEPSEGVNNCHHEVFENQDGTCFATRWKDGTLEIGYDLPGVTFDEIDDASEACRPRSFDQAYLAARFFNKARDAFYANQKSN